MKFLMDHFGELLLFFFFFVGIIAGFWMIMEGLLV